MACVQKLVRERPASITLKALAEEMGVTPMFMTSLVTGKLNGASVLVIERIYTRLSGKPLVEHCEPEQHSA